MNKILTEKQYQQYIIDYLVSHDGYIERKNDDIDKNYALDKELLFKFLEDTQPDAIERLKKIFKDKYEETIINSINNKIIGKSSSLIEVLKSEIEISNVKIRLLYTKPATTFNKELNENYTKNIFSVVQEVYTKSKEKIEKLSEEEKQKERVDLVICINGFVITVFELKCNESGQNYEDAIRQFREDRDPKSRLFLFKAGSIVDFAMDLEECYMTTKLNGTSTYFLPFNKGKGEGIETGKGNPLNSDGFGVSYMWEDILTKDALLDILSRFVFVERKKRKIQLPVKKKQQKSLSSSQGITNWIALEKL